MDYKYRATYFGILMDLYLSDKPIHCSYFAEKSIETEINLFANTHFLIEKGFIEKVKIFQTERDSPCFKISEKGKKFVERIMDNFPLIE